MGMQKPQSFYRTVLWDAAEINMLVHHPMNSSQKEHVSGWGWMDERDSWNWEGVEGAKESVLFLGVWFVHYYSFSFIFLFFILYLLILINSALEGLVRIASAVLWHFPVCMLTYGFLL